MFLKKSLYLYLILRKPQEMAFVLQQTRHGSCSTASVDKLDLLPLLAQSLTEKPNLTWQRVRKLFLLDSFPQNNALLIKEAN